MKIIGLYFGTTSSTISFFNNEGVLASFEPFNGINYIPTVVSYYEGDIEIGNSAKKNRTVEHEVYENFKLLLGKNFNVVIKNKSKTPSEVTANFIEELLKKYIKKQKIDGIDSIVMTVPEVWFYENSNRTARENIQSIYKRLKSHKGFEKSQLKLTLRSEPEAAAAYFCRSYKLNKD